MSERPTEILDATMNPAENDAAASTVGEYLCALLTTLWTEYDLFNSKRPFGNSGWQPVVYLALINNGFMDGGLDGWGEAEYTDEAAAQADRDIVAAIRGKFASAG